jgi:2,3-dihydroxybenzoate decarboxylase
VDAACREFERVVKTLRMPGVLLNGFQLVGDERGALFYDQPEYDAFWETAQRLDAPVYLHPGPNAGGMLDIKGYPQYYAKFPWLHSAAWFWAVETGSHALRIITSGVFDRFPKAQLVLGHNGEHIVGDIWRLDKRIANMPLPVPYPAKKPVRSYFKSNVHITTSGEFSDPALRHMIQEIGSDRVLFAIDTPYEHMEEGAAWFDTAPLSVAERQAIARGNAIRVFKLPVKA